MTSNNVLTEIMLPGVVGPGELPNGRHAYFYNIWAGARRRERFQARLRQDLSLKVAAADGATDVSQMIAAIDWVVEHRNDKDLNIRVLNLSFGTDSLQPADVDPLSFAVEQAWSKGIVVVVAAGNNGLASTSLTMPAVNPDVIAVGAADSMGTDSRADDTVADFTNRGNATRHPDVLAPGRSIVSLRDPESYIDRTYPGARLSTTADPAQRFFRGSGTSQAAAVTSGAAALLLQRNPALTPDQVKVLLATSATPIPLGTVTNTGAGLVNVYAAESLAAPVDVKGPSAPATGTGSLELARGASHVAAKGVTLNGEQDIFAADWGGASWAEKAAAGTTWTGGTWNGNVWTGTGWTASGDWAATTWAKAWFGSSWPSGGWVNRKWTADGWDSRTWGDDAWDSLTWGDNAWATSGWG
jgi:serine protease AprX